MTSGQLDAEALQTKPDAFTDALLFGVHFSTKFLKTFGLCNSLCRQDIC